MTDTRSTTASNPGASPSEKVKAFIGDLARPFILYSAALTSSYAVARVAGAIADALKLGHGSFEGAAIFIGAVLGGVGAIYIGKSFEVASVAKHEAAVKTAAVQAAPPTSTVTMTPPADLTITPADDGELPESERIK